jgi:hypothetical protein
LKEFAVRRKPLSSLTLAILFVVADGRAFSQEDPLEQPAAKAAEFLEALSENVDDAYTALLKDSPLARDAERSKKIVADTKKLFAPGSAYGKPRAEEPVERIKAQRIGKDLAVLRYVYKFDQLPVVWHFTFYRTNGKWLLVGVRFDHDYEGLGA